MARLVTLLLLADIALLIVAMVDCLSAEEGAIRALPRGTWMFVILLLSPIGAIAWFVAGQPVPAIRLHDGSVLRPGRIGPIRTLPNSVRPLRPVPVFAGPEDDPEFVRFLAENLDRQRESDPNP